MPQKDQLQLTKSDSEIDFIRSLENYTISRSVHRYLLVDKKDKTIIPFKTRGDVHTYTQPNEGAKTKSRRSEEIFQTKKKTYFWKGIISQLFGEFKKLGGF